MNNKYKIIFGVMLIVTVSAVVWYYFSHSKKENIPFSSMKMFEGQIMEKGNGTILLQNINSELDYATMTKKQSAETINFSVHKNATFEELTTEQKTEEEMQADQANYENWQKKPEAEKDAFSLLFPPVWNKSKKISFSDLEKGDLVRVVYYNSGNKNMIVKIVKEIKIEGSRTAETSVSKKYSFSADILELSSGKLKVKTSSDLSVDKPAGEIIDLVLDDQTVIKKAMIKSEEEFRKEEKSFLEEKEKVKEAGGDILSLVAPSRYQESNILVGDLLKDKSIDIEAVFDGQIFKAINIRQVKK